jgi:L-lactate dehydrogenase (cytochrome)
MRQETLRTMALLGCASVADVGREHVRLAASAPAFMSGKSASHGTPRQTV